MVNNISNSAWILIALIAKRVEYVSHSEYYQQKINACFFFVYSRICFVAIVDFSHQIGKRVDVFLFT